MPWMRWIAALALFAIAAAASGQAAEGDASEPTGESRWEVHVSPYLLLAGMDGTVAANGAEAEFDVDFGDIFDALDIALFGTVEVKRDRLSLTTNVMYVDLSPETNRAVGSALPSAPPGDFSVGADLQTIVFEVAPGFEVASLAIGEAGRVALDLRTGLRYVWMKTELRVDLDPGSPLGPFSRDFRATTDWADVLVGARVRAQLTRKLGLVVSGDVGGFELGSGSELTWSAQGFLLYALGEHWSLGGGWRSLDIDRGPNEFRMEGPLLGGSYRF